MSLDFKGLQDEVKRRALRNEGGSEFDVGTRNIINGALFTIAMAGLWRKLRRITTFDTIIKYTTGSGGGTFTNDSKNITIVGATFLTDNIQPGRKIKLQGSTRRYNIKTITGETTLTIDRVYDGTTISGTGTYSILPQEEYNLPIQTNHRVFLWHEDLGFPFRLRYITDQDFYNLRISNTTEQTPDFYRMWGENSVKEQLKDASVITISSSVSADTNIAITVFGTVADFPDFETITTNASNGTTTVAGSKSFTEVDRVVCSTSRTGRITATGNSANTIVAVLPVGNTTTSIQYSKVQLWPLPNRIFPINVQFYKEPYAMVNDGDVHEFGDKFDEAIILLATARLNYEQGKGDDGDNMMKDYRGEIRTLKKKNADKIDWTPTLRRGNAFTNFDPLVMPNLSFRQVGANFGPSSGGRF